MSIEQLVNSINDEIIELTEEDEDLLTWEMEIEIKEQIVSYSEASAYFTDETELENMYTYEMFDKERKIPNETLKLMIHGWISALQEVAGIEINTDISELG